jgi:AcrR family transcriptional regulator
MARNYTKSKRAENEAETRRRIVEATVDLHRDVGPARTTISMIAERAGVQRHTVYAHFPEELELHMACSGHYMERNPLPSPDLWQAINDPKVRIRNALTELYGWYAKNAAMMSSVLRDAEIHPMTRKVTELRSADQMHAIEESVSVDLGTKGVAALTLAMSFHTWRTLTEDAGLDSETAAELMAAAVYGVDG